MARTHKDSKGIAKSVLELTKREDGTFDLFLNHKLDRSRIPERWLEEELCARFGFCGEEYLSILRAVESGGTTEIVF